MYHKHAIENYPLQVYASALLFSPSRSLIKRLFNEQSLTYVEINPAIQERWNACLLTIEGHRGGVNSVIFSHDSARLASASYDKTIKVWNASTGECIQTLEGHSNVVNSVVFSHDSTRLASASDDRTIKVWNASTGECLQTLQIGERISTISFDITDSYLYTDIGTITLHGSSLNEMQSVTNSPDPQNAQYRGWGLSPDGMWIRHDSENLVWLPSEYIPACSTVSNMMIGFGVGSGKVWICRFEGNGSEYF